VHVHPVVRRFSFRGDSLEIVTHRALATRAGRSGDVEVVAERLDLEPERNRLARARLADRPVKRLHVCGALEVERGRIEPAPHLSRSQRQPIARAHATSSHRSLATSRASARSDTTPRVTNASQVFGVSTYARSSTTGSGSSRPSSIAAGSNFSSNSRS